MSSSLNTPDDTFIEVSNEEAVINELFGDSPDVSVDELEENERRLQEERQTEEEGLNLQLLLGEDIFVSGIPVLFIPSSKLARYGYTKLLKQISLIALDEYSIPEAVKKEVGNLSIFEFTCALLMLDETVRTDFCAGMSFITGQTTTFDIKSETLKIGGIKITSDIYIELKRVICRRYLFDAGSEEEKYNPANERARRLIEKSKQYNRKLAKMRGEEDNEMSVTDLISIYAACARLSPVEVGKLDLFQINDQLGRYKVQDDWQVGIQALMHGAHSEDINLRHWLTRFRDIRSAD